MSKTSSTHSPSSAETAQLEQSILKLKNSIQDIIHEEKIYNEDLYLLRWLLSADMDVKKAEKYLRTNYWLKFQRYASIGWTATWRKEYDVPSLLEADYPQEVMESLPLYLDALTPDGILVSTVQGGLIDFRDLLDKYGRKAVVRYVMQMHAQVETVLLAKNKKNLEGKPITKQSVEGFVGIVDFDKFQARQLRTFEGIQAIIEVCKNNVKYFPYLMSRLIIINCNSVASIAIKIVRPILETRITKVEVYGCDRSEWQGVISSLLPVHLLRESFGGTRVKEENIPRTQFIDRHALQPL